MAQVVDPMECFQQVKIASIMVDGVWVVSAFDVLRVFQVPRSDPHNVSITLLGIADTNLLQFPSATFLARNLEDGRAGRKYESLSCTLEVMSELIMVLNTPLAIKLRLSAAEVFAN